MKHASMIASLIFCVVACALLLPAAVQADCDAGAKPSTPTADFEFLDGGAVVRHRQSGLEWLRCPEGMTFTAGKAADHSQDACAGTAATFDQAAAGQISAQVNAGAGRYGEKDWRLPSMDELFSIVEDACHMPAVNPRLFPDTPVTWFWATASKELPSGGTAWGVSYGFGGYYVGRNDYGAVRLVRGGH